MAVGKDGRRVVPACGFVCCSCSHGYVFLRGCKVRVCGGGLGDGMEKWERERRGRRRGKMDLDLIFLGSS